MVTFFIIMAVFLSAALLFTWLSRGKHIYMVKLGWASVFALSTCFLIQGIYFLFGKLPANYAPTVNPVSVFNSVFYIMPILVAALAILLYFRRTPIIDGYLEAGLIGVYVVLWYSGFELVHQFFFTNNKVLDYMRAIPYTVIAFSPFIAAFLYQSFSRRGQLPVTEKPGPFKISVWSFNLALTLLGALLVGLLTSLPALFQLPEGVLILPFLALLLGYLSRSWVGIWISSLFVVSGHVLGLTLGLILLGWKNADPAYLLMYSVLDLMFTGWWLAALPITVLAWLGRMTRSNQNLPRVVMALLIAVTYGASLFLFEIPDSTTSYSFVSFIRNSNLGDNTPADLKLSVPLPTVNGLPQMGMIPCPNVGNSDKIPTIEQIVDSKWGPTFEAQVGGSPERVFSRCPLTQSPYTEVSPLKFVPLDPTSTGQKFGSYKLSSKDGYVPLDVSLILYTRASKAGLLSPFLSAPIIWASYGHEERMDIKTSPKDDWQSAPILPGPQTYQTDQPYVEPFNFE